MAEADDQINWFRIIADLQRVAVSSYDIAERIGVSHTTVLRWGQGSEPRHSDGEKLLRIWSQKTGLPVDQAPRIYIYAAI